MSIQSWNREKTTSQGYLSQYSNWSRLEIKKASIGDKPRSGARSSKSKNGSKSGLVFG
jgi:hypothetical protein